MKKLIYLVARLVPALIMGQTLFYKFSAAPESVYIFEKIGIEPWGRWSTGILELVAAVFLVWPRMAWIGAALGALLMAGAVAMHATVLGIEVQGDRGLLFIYALLVLLCCIYVLVQNLERIQNDVIPKLFRK